MSDLMEYKCPCCGGAISFNSDAQKMVCPFCDTEFDVETLKACDDVLNVQGTDTLDWNEEHVRQWDEGEEDSMTVYVCQSCGGEIIVDENTAASQCPYCDSPVVMRSKLSGTLKPDLVVPFQISKEAAKNALKNHMSGKKLLPKVFKDENHIDEIKGIYVPFWLFDCDTDANIAYNATRTRAWSDSDYNYVETSHFLVTRGGTVGFDNVPVDGSSHMPDDLMESIEPFDFSNAVDFQTAYLAGYLADKYDVTAEESRDRANVRIKRSTEELFAETVMGYETVGIRSSQVSLTKGDVHYALLPVWILNTSWNGEKYLFAMNGQTGKFVGNLPMDKGAAVRWFAGVFAGVSVIASAIGLLLM
ncbi:MAG: hypothetical protein U0M15_02055 [Bacillota bacterium]|nr:hypothetical protein [Bacillota bacterium]